MTSIRNFVVLCFFAFPQLNAFSQVVKDDCLDATVTLNQMSGIIDSGKIQRGIQVILLEHATGDVFIKRIVKINDEYVYIQIKCIKPSKELQRKRIIITMPEVLPEQFNEIEKIQSTEKISEIISSKLKSGPYPSGIRYGEYDLASKQWKTIKIPKEYKSAEQPEIKMIFKFFDKFEIID